jgi:hypothetical protein
MINPQDIRDKLAVRPQHLRALFEHGVGSESTLSQMAATMLLSHWQASSTWDPLHPPSFLLVNAGPGDDPCMQLARAAFFRNTPERLPKETDVQPIDPVTGLDIPTMARAEASMEHYIGNAKQVTANMTIIGESARQHRSRDLALNQKAIYGAVKAGFYGRHTHPKFGVASDERGCASLWVESTEDLAQFHTDLLKEQSIYWNPWGFDASLERRRIKTSIIGSITAEQFTSDLVNDIIASSAPLVILPHTSPQAPVQLNLEEFHKILNCSAPIEARFAGSVHQHDSRKFGGGYRLYEQLLRRRLMYCPPDHEFHVLSLVRQLYSRCCYLVQGVLFAEPENEKRVWADTLFPLIFENALRGIAIGIEALVFHCHGLPLDEKHFVSATKYLGYLRQHGPCTPRALLKRFQTVPMETRDHLLSLFEKEGLVTRIGGNRIMAVPVGEFFESLPKRPLMPSSLSWADTLPPTYQLLPGEAPP